MTVTVYIDDITISGLTEAEVQDALTSLEEAAAAARLSFNPVKVRLPAASVTNFNIAFGSGSVLVTDARMAQFQHAFDQRSGEAQLGIYGYVASIDPDQADSLI